MADGFKRILFAVRDSRQVTRSALEKLAALAAPEGARIDVYHALTESVVLDRVPVGAEGRRLDAVFDAIVAKAETQLARRASRAAPAGVRIQTRVDWDYPAHEAIVRQTRETRADLVAVAVESRGFAARLFLRNTDWELIRHCPVPLLLLKRTRRYERPAVLVAVDPFHAADKPASLDRALLAIGARIAQRTRGALHAVHAYQPLALGLTATAGMPVAGWLPADVEARHEQQMRRGFERLVERAGVAPERRHLVAGTVPDALDQVLRRVPVALLVMGAVSRRGLQRLFIGSTAEREIDRVSCDVLVVKPPRFRSEVGAAERPEPQVPAARALRPTRER